MDRIFKHAIDQLRARNAELEAEVARLNAHAVEVYKEDRKAYLVQQVEVARLRKANTESKRLLRIVFDTWMPPSKMIDETYRAIEKALEASDG